VLPPRKEVHQAEHSISLRPQIPAQTSGTIDLKKLRPHGSQQMEETGPGHVINLKKRS